MFYRSLCVSLFDLDVVLNICEISICESDNPPFVDLNVGQVSLCDSVGPLVLNVLTSARTQSVRMINCDKFALQRQIRRQYFLPSHTTSKRYGLVCSKDLFCTTEECEECETDIDFELFFESFADWDLFRAVSWLSMLCSGCQHYCVVLSVNVILLYWLST